MNFKYFPSLVTVIFLAANFVSCNKNDNNPGGKNAYNPNYILNKQDVGNSANDLLAATNYRHLEVEIQYADGYEPSSAAINNFKTFLNQRLNKPSGITYKFSPIIAPNQQTYSLLDIQNIERMNRTVYTRKDTIGIYFFFADGAYSQDTDNSKILGVAYQNTSMVLFEKTIQNFSDDINEPSRFALETVVWQHEMGHILGLVNTGSPMQTIHQDEPHGHHCTNKNCLMYYTAETGDVITNLVTGGTIPSLDQNCIDDLRANGGK